MGDSGVTIDLLCKVVDNYGDIGVVYRLARALSALPDPPRIRLIVDDLAAFAALYPAIDPNAGYQRVQGWEVFGWGTGLAGPPALERASDAEPEPAPDPARESFRERPPRLVIECFACGRPEWLEAILFDPAAGKSLVVDLEYLTAEDYAEEFHRMPSLTRSSLVAKAMFLPGFAAGTGGLILDPAFVAAAARASSDEGRASLRRGLLERLGPAASDLPPEAPGDFWIAVFSYERDYARVVADLAAFSRDGLGTGGRKLLALVAAGRSQSCFLEAWEKAGEPFPAIALPFLPQETWDEALLACDFAIVRGEDSWARAALSGRPFLWHAYPQEDRYQMVKVRAFLDRLRPHFEAGVFAPLEALYLAFNDRDADGRATRGDERLLDVLARHDELRPGFEAFSRATAARGDLALHLLTFLREML